MGANFSLDFVQSVGAFVFLCISYLKGLLLPDEHGASAFLPKVTDQLKKLDRQKVIDGEEFPGSSLSFSPYERCNWMTKIHEVHRPIGQILWPGTHYSATNKIGIPFITRPFGQRQTMSIIDQLFDGIRALDIRIQQDHRVCSGNMLCDTTIGDVISDIKLFLDKTKFEIIILEIQTERGFYDPENFEDYLVENFGNRLIHQDDQVFSKSISEVLPGRIICIWKPILNAFMPRQGGPIWSGKYLQCDEFDTQMPLTRFEGNIHNLKGRSAALKINNYFYKVENTLNPQTSTALESLLVWPKYANVVSKRINGFSRLFLAKCCNDGTLSRLQVYSVDFVNDDFISACIGLSQESTTTQVSLFSDESSEINQTIDQAAHLAALAESKRREDDLKNALQVEKDECRAKIEKAMNEMRTEAAETKVAGKMKLREAHTMVEDAQKKLAEAQAKLQEVEAREDDLRRRIISFKSECDAKENEMDTLRAEIDKERSALNEEKASLSTKEEESSMLVEIRRNDNNNASTDIINNSSSSNDVDVPSTSDNNSNVVDETTITWETSQSRWIRSKNLTITHCEDDKCWNWVNYKWGSISYEAAHFLQVNSLNMMGNCKIEDDLLQQVSYEVLFWVKILDSPFGWESPIHVRLTLPDGSIQANQLILDTTPSENLYISVGKFITPMKGEIKYSLEQLDNTLKGGIVIHGVFIQQSFVDLVIPKDLSIKFHDVGECWRWSAYYSSYAKRRTEYVKLISVRDLKVDGIFETEKLVFGCTYKVGFMIKLRSAATGWESPTKLTLRLPNGCLQQRRGSFNDMPRDKDILIYAGEFKMSPEMVGKLDFSMENNNEVEKTGMEIVLAFIQQHH